ncbi:MAG: Flp pilus assembly protein CpaB [Candidatus Acidiferrales bacterium]
MNRSRIIIAMAVAIVLGLIVSSIVYRALNRTVIQTVAAPTIPHIDIVVAASRLPLGWRLQPSQLRVIQWPGTNPLPGSFSRIEDCAGRALIAPTVENEPILEGKLAPREGGAGLPARIPEGMRAVSVPVNDVVSVAGFVQPGTMVDVLVTGGSAGGGSNTRTILENVRVLAAGQRIEQDSDGQPQSSSVVTLLVNPEDASKLTMASMEGRIQLALRNVIDTGKVEPPPVYSAALFGGEAPAMPVKHASGMAPRATPPPPPSNFSIEVIRGSKREVDSFPNP